MSSKFLSYSGGTVTAEDITNGSIDAVFASASITNASPNSALKTDSNSKIISSNLEISDTNGLQTALDNTLTNPFVGTLTVDDLKTDSVCNKTGVSCVNLTATEIDLVATTVNINGVPIVIPDISNLETKTQNQSATVNNTTFVGDINLTGDAYVVSNINEDMTAVASIGALIGCSYIQNVGIESASGAASGGSTDYPNVKNDGNLIQVLSTAFVSVILLAQHQMLITLPMLIHLV